MNTAILTQARMASTRLPGKVLMTISGKTILEYHCKRALWSGLPVIVTTTTNAIDNAIVLVCQKLNLPYFAGDSLNVLKRYYNCARQFRLDCIIRITADCPLIDGHLIHKGLKQFQLTKPDYLSNTLTRTYPQGFDFEIFTFEMLEEAYTHARDAFEKEHVTPYIWRNTSKRFTIHQFKRSADNSYYKVAIDKQSDFQMIRKLIIQYRADIKSCEEIIAILDRHPEIATINCNQGEKNDEK